MFGFLLPTSVPFFEMLLEQNLHLRTISRELANMATLLESRDEALKNIALQEDEADKIYLKFSRELSHAFITPIDREDLHRIGQIQEDLIDNLHHLATRLHIYGSNDIPFSAVQILNSIHNMLSLTEEILVGLSHKKDVHKTKVFRARREDCAMLLSVGMAEILDIKDYDGKSLLEVIRWSQFYDRLEQSVELVVKCVEAMEEAVLKNA